MRDIKFRAWFSQERKMIAPASIQQIAECGCSSGFTDHCIFLQYTGMKDCNGVEIYEGDILKCTPNGFVWVVFFDDRGSFVAADPSCKLEFVFLDDYQFDVIGNIYENPELLEADK